MSILPGHCGHLLTCSKVDQDNFLLANCNPDSPKRKRSKQFKKTRSISVEYKIPHNGLVSLNVCQKVWLSVLSMISRFRLQNICKQFFLSGKISKELRGKVEEENS